MAEYNWNGDFNVQGAIKHNGIEINYNGQSEPTLTTEVSYTQLKTLRDNSNLVIGMNYLISDYQCTTSKANTAADATQAYIIVKAIANNKLDEEGIMIQSQVVFKVWYCLDNDTDRFDWANTSTGKGVIYRMIDENHNDIPYDFIHMKFTYNYTDYKAFNNIYTFSCWYGSSPSTAVWREASMKWPGSSGAGTTHYFKYNKIDASYIDSINSRKQLLYGNIFYSTGSSSYCYANHIGAQSRENFFSIQGNICHHNNLGDSCYHNTFKGGNIQNNRFDDGCSSNEINYDFTGNTFGRGCSHNVTESGGGGAVSSTTLAAGCNYNTLHGSKNVLGNGCQYNTFSPFNSGIIMQKDCSHNTFGRYVYNVCLGEDCSYIKIGTAGSTATYYAKNILIENNCKYIDLICSQDTSGSESNYLQNIHIHMGIQGNGIAEDPGEYLTIDVPARNISYNIDYKPTGSQEINV